jgi:hypothetical protein
MPIEERKTLWTQKHGMKEVVCILHHLTEHNLKPVARGRHLRLLSLWTKLARPSTSEKNKREGLKPKGKEEKGMRGPSGNEAMKEWYVAYGARKCRTY